MASWCQSSLFRDWKAYRVKRPWNSEENKPFLKIHSRCQIKLDQKVRPNLFKRNQGLYKLVYHHQPSLMLCHVLPCLRPSLVLKASTDSKLSTSNHWCFLFPNLHICCNFALLHFLHQNNWMAPLCCCTACLGQREKPWAILSSWHRTQNYWASFPSSLAFPSYLSFFPCFLHCAFNVAPKPGLSAFGPRCLTKLWASSPRRHGHL